MVRGGCAGAVVPLCERMLLPILEPFVLKEALISGLNPPYRQSFRHSHPWEKIAVWCAGTAGTPRSTGAPSVAPSPLLVLRALVRAQAAWQSRTACVHAWG
jgi:hypothetical protein